jgi:hypothetical protein
MRMKITKRKIDALIRGAILADEEVRGFVARKLSTGAVTYGFRYRNKPKGDALKQEVDKQAWDDSVKAPAGTPEVLAMMSDRLDSPARDLREARTVQNELAIAPGLRKTVSECLKAMGKRESQPG